MKCNGQKAKFDSEQEAKNRILHLQTINKTEYVPLRTYYCADCAKWHLTSKVDKRQLLIEKLMETCNKLKAENARLKSYIDTSTTTLRIADDVSRTALNLIHANAKKFGEKIYELEMVVETYNNRRMKEKINK